MGGVSQLFKWLQRIALNYFKSGSLSTDFCSNYIDVLIVNLLHAYMVFTYFMYLMHFSKDVCPVLLYSAKLESPLNNVYGIYMYFVVTCHVNFSF